MGIRRFFVPLAIGAVVLIPAAVSAQGSGDGFLFRTPRVQLGLRLGYAGAAAGSDIFDFTREELTLDRSDFSGGLFGAELAFRATERLDLVLAFANASTSNRSEFRDWVDEDDLPIEQVTDFTRRPFTASVRYFLADRGRSLSRFAWIPNRVAPYVGAGVGLMWYEFVQEGDFVDFEDLAIFTTRYTSQGTSLMGQVMAGAEVSVSPRLFMTVDGRYEWASAEMGQDFQLFEDIDLSGFQVSVGLGVRF